MAHSASALGRSPVKTATRRRGTVLVLIAVLMVPMMAMIAFSVVDSNWQGNNKHVTIAKSYAYMGDLRPQPDLSNTSGTIEGVFTAPALVE